MILLLSAALAAEPRNAVVVGLTGGLDHQTSQPFVAGEIVLLPAQQLGPSVIARLAPGLGLGEGLPLGLAELGFTWGIPNPEATIRVGASVRPIIAGSHGKMPLTFAGRPGVDAYGVLMVGAGVLEFEWNPRAPLTVGIRGGVGSVGAAFGCGERPEGFDDCRAWTPGFVGGFIARKRFVGRVAIELQIGTTSTLSIGARLGKPTPAP